MDFQALEEEIDSHAADVHQAVKIGQSLSSLTCRAEQGVLSEKLDSLQARFNEIQDRCCRKAALLEQALSNARLFGEDEVEVLNWLAEVEDKLSTVFVKDYRQDVLQKQHADHLVFMFPCLLVMLLPYFVISIHVSLHFSIFFLIPNISTLFYMQVHSYRLVAKD